MTLYSKELEKDSIYSLQKKSQEETNMHPQDSGRV